MDSNNIQQKNEKVVIAAGVVGLVLIVILTLFIYTQNQYRKIDDLKNPIVRDSENKNPSSANNIVANSLLGIQKDLNTEVAELAAAKKAFANVRLFAKSAAVWDVRNQKFIYQKNVEDVRPLASLTKLMTALAAVELLPKESTIQIVQEYLQEENGGGLLAYERWNADDLISLTLVASSNVGSRAIATVAGAFLPADSLKGNSTASNTRQNFIDHLNDRADQLGLESMRFYNDSGLDVNPTQSGAYGSAEDVAKLTNYILDSHPELLESTTHSKLSLVSNTKFVHNIKNTNTAVNTIPGLLASKTGYTDLAQGNLTVAFSPGLEGPYIAVILGSTYDGRFTDIEKLVAATIQAVSK